MGLRLQTIGDFARLPSRPHRKQRPARAAPLGSRRVHRRQAVFVTWTLLIPLLSTRGGSCSSRSSACRSYSSFIDGRSSSSSRIASRRPRARRPSELRARPRTWAVHQVESTVDFCPRNPVLTWLLGGLNFQIEHHLFPRVPHTHYPKIARIVRRTAEKHDVRYTVQQSLRAAITSHGRHLREHGRTGPGGRARDGLTDPDG